MQLQAARTWLVHCPLGSSGTSMNRKLEFLCHRDGGRRLCITGGGYFKHRQGRDQSLQAPLSCCCNPTSSLQAMGLAFGSQDPYLPPAWLASSLFLAPHSVRQGTVSFDSGSGRQSHLLRGLEPSSWAPVHLRATAHLTVSSRVSFVPAPLSAEECKSRSP